MNNYKIMLYIFMCITLNISGCSKVVIKDWQATGGSRADATVKLSYQRGAYEIPQLSDQQAIDLATKRCSTWGYTGAEPFGGQTVVCNQYDKYLGCIDSITTKEFQCTGDGAIKR